MSDHDPLCRQQHWEGGDCFDCRLIARVRADERDKVGEMGIRAARKGAAIAVTEWKAEFRAQVETLPIYHSDAKMQYVLRPSVLNLIDRIVPTEP